MSEGDVCKTVPLRPGRKSGLRTCGRPGHQSVKQFSRCLAVPRNAAAGKMAMDASMAREGEAANRASWASDAARICGKFC